MRVRLVGKRTFTDSKDSHVFLLNLSYNAESWEGNRRPEEMTTGKVFIYFKVRDKLVRIDASKIVYFEADGNFTHIIMVNKLRTTICMNLSKMEQSLDEQMGDDAHIFMRIGKRFIINMQYVYLVDAYEQKLVLSDYEHFAFEVKISKDALKNMIDLMLVAKV